MKLAQLETFLHVIQHKSFSKAALDLGLSQSTVSYTIQELERNLGMSLFKRGRLGAELTPLGERVAVLARDMLRSQQAIYQEVSMEQGDLHGEVRVASFRSAAGRILPRVIAQLKDEHPQLRVKLIDHDSLPQASHRKYMVENHHVDLAFFDHTLPQKTPDTIIMWQVMKDKLYALLPQHDPRTKLSWQEATKEALILQHGDGHVCSHSLRILRQYGMVEEPAYIVHEDSTIVHMVSQGLGIGILPRLAIDELPQGVKRVPIHKTVERTIDVGLMPSSLRVPGVRAFLAVLKQHYPKSELPVLQVRPVGVAY